MKYRFKFSDVPLDFGRSMPDGDFTIGRGADPSGQLAGRRPIAADKEAVGNSGMRLSGRVARAKVSGQFVIRKADGFAFSARDRSRSRKPYAA